ncbi:MAG: hypothetical protein HY220_00650 [Candidatus Sungbacteria bacterium]|uniref:Uncharacterized protein n=1 Tax=Candidatus Sungiibacteriota bacterium TaxID=2750080 RepID=A0A9D6QTS9_9BACT|nr:hypothetical protein [Candidatus Sungbacteria bacterium]
MHQKLPKDDARYQWTNHVVHKMRQYALSESRVKRVVLNPKRIEAGIAPKTIAVMQSVGTMKKPFEIWVMYQELGNSKKEIGNSKKKTFAAFQNFQPVRKRIITAWRYPGKSKPRDKPPVPQDILDELVNGLN